MAKVDNSPNQGHVGIVLPAQQLSPTVSDQLLQKFNYSKSSNIKMDTQQNFDEQSCVHYSNESNSENNSQHVNMGIL